jgi:hypothetical protein
LIPLSFFERMRELFAPLLQQFLKHVRQLTKRLNLEPSFVWLPWNAPSGDPGSRVVNQLIPGASAVPGCGTTSLPWSH